MFKADKFLRPLIKDCRIRPDSHVRLKDYETDWRGARRLPKERRDRVLENLLAKDISKLAKAQDLLYASHSWAVLLVLQAMDAAGKDSTIKHVMSGVNPQGCRVHSFKQPSPEDLDHTFLWRCMNVLPERGAIGIFNRSYYEEVLVVRVHPELVAAEHIPDVTINNAFWKTRYRDINDFERHLVSNGTLIVKFFLHVSKDEQRKRFLERLTNPKKHWKFSPRDIEERSFWKDYEKAYEDCLSATSTEHAPWHVVPADDKRLARTVVATIITQEIGKLHLEYPRVTKEQRKQIEIAKAKLERGGR